MGLFGRSKQAGLSAEHQRMVDDAIRAAGVDPAALPLGLPEGGMLAQLKAAQAGIALQQRYARLQQFGQDVRGTVLEVRPAGHESELRLAVQAGAPYEVTIRQALPAFPLRAGMEVMLRVDPEDRGNVAVWGGVPDAAPARRDPLDALADLADRRDQGLIGEAEYEAERQRLLAEL